MKKYLHFEDFLYISRTYMFQTIKQIVILVKDSQRKHNIQFLKVDSIY